MNEIKNPLLESMSNKELFLLFQKRNMEDVQSLIQIEKTLSEQKYDLEKLEKEKEEIIALVDEEIFEFTSTEIEVLKKKKEMKTSVYYVLGILVISVMIYQQNLKGLSIDRQPPIYLYFGVSLIFIIYLIYKTIAFKKSQDAFKLLDLTKKTELEKKRNMLRESWGL